jgi:hypothetical protein
MRQTTIDDPPVSVRWGRWVAALLLAVLALGLWWLAPRVELELALHWAAPRLTLSLGAGLR